MSRRQTVEQERARRAMICVDQAKKEKLGGRYAALARSAPASIQTNGLGQVLAFWCSKKEKEHSTIYNHVSTWVCGRMGWSEDLLKRLIAEDSTTGDYRRATSEAMAFLAWLKRFAEAELGTEEER